MLLHICLSIVVTVVIVVAFAFIHIQLNVDYFNCTRFHNMLYLRFIPTNIIEYFFRMPIANFTLVVQLRAILFVVVCCSTETFRWTARMRECMLNFKPNYSSRQTCKYIYNNIDTRTRTFTIYTRTVLIQK